MSHSKVKKLGLCAMLKNEGHIVRRLLDSCKPIISAVVLTDTGSEEDTIEQTEAWCKENDMPLKVFREPWVNFGVSRTKSVINACSAFSDITHYLLLDGDMVLEIGKDWTVDSLILDEIRLYQINQGAKYVNTRIISTSKFFRCVGTTHEYYGSPTSITSGEMTALTIHDLNDGGSRSDKHERDKRLLLKAMRENITPDYLMGRYSFYLGQTYQGYCNYRLSNYWYKRRIEIGGWHEEIFFSYYQIGENHRRDGNFKKGMYYSLKAWDHTPTRAEPLLTLVQCCRGLGLKRLASFYAEMGKKMKMGNETLFLDLGCYDGSKFEEELKALHL
jgi:hypothetical protein